MLWYQFCIRLCLDKRWSPLRVYVNVVICLKYCVQVTAPFQKSIIMSIFNVLLTMFLEINWFNFTREYSYCQEVFIKIWRFSNKFDGSSKLKTWIYRIVVNTCLDALKSNKNNSNIDDYEIMDTVDLTDVSYMKKQNAQKIQAALIPMSSPDTYT